MSDLIPLRQQRRFVRQQWPDPHHLILLDADDLALFHVALTHALPFLADCGLAPAHLARVAQHRPHNSTHTRLMVSIFHGHSAVSPVTHDELRQVLAFQGYLHPDAHVQLYREGRVDPISYRHDGITSR